MLSSNASSSQQTRYYCGPTPTGTFDSIEQATQYLKDHGFEHGWMHQKKEYPPKARQTGDGLYPYYYEYACNKSRKPDEVANRQSDAHESKQRKGSGTVRTGCPFIVKLFPDSDNRASCSWTFARPPDKTSYHNHRPHIHPSAEPRHRLSFATPEVTRDIIDLYISGSTPAKILSILRRKNPLIALVAKDIENILRYQRQLRLGKLTPIQWLMIVRIPYNIIYLYTNN